MRRRLFLVAAPLAGCATATPAVVQDIETLVARAGGLWGIARGAGELALLAVEVADPALAPVALLIREFLASGTALAAAAPHSATAADELINLSNNLSLAAFPHVTVFANR